MHSLYVKDHRAVRISHLTAACSNKCTVFHGYLKKMNKLLLFSETSNDHLCIVNLICENNINDMTSMNVSNMYLETFVPILDLQKTSESPCNKLSNTSF